MKRGRPSSPDSCVHSFSVRLNKSNLEYLSLWGSCPSIQINDLLDRARLFWPAGPFVFGHARKTGGAL